LSTTAALVLLSMSSAQDIGLRPPLPLLAGGFFLPCPIPDFMTEITSACIQINKALRLPPRQYVLATSAKFLPGRGVWFIKFRDPASALPRAWNTDLVSPPAPLIPASAGGRYRIDGPVPFWPWGTISGVPAGLAHQLCALAPAEAGGPLLGVFTRQTGFFIRGSPPIQKIDCPDSRPNSRTVTIRLLFSTFDHLAQANISGATIDGATRDVRIYLDAAELGPLPRFCSHCGREHDPSSCASSASGPPFCHLCGSREHGGRGASSCPLWKEAGLQRRREVALCHFEVVHRNSPTEFRDYRKTLLALDLGLLDDDPPSDMEWEATSSPDPDLLLALRSVEPSHPQHSPESDPDAEATKRARISLSPDPPPPDEAKGIPLSSPAAPQSALPSGGGGSL
jgi:hypothetical protein